MSTAIDNTNKKTVLVVEDNEPDKVLVSTRIRQKWPNVDIISGTSIAKAIEILNQQAVNIVLLDLNLDDSKGSDTVKELRSLYEDLSIVVLTGLANDKTVSECLKLGANHVAVKSQLLNDDFFNILEENSA